MARRSRSPSHPIRTHGRLLFIVPSFSGSTDEEGDTIEYLVDIEPFETWRRVPQTIHMTDGSEREIMVLRRIIQPYCCTCPDFSMRPLHPCKHIREVVEEFFPEYLVEE